VEVRLVSEFGRAAGAGHRVTPPAGVHAPARMTGKKSIGRIAPESSFLAEVKRSE
jgi:hypothetical protein